MSITLGARSVARLEGVHPDLVRVVRRAAQMATAEEDFTILEGVRADEQAFVNFGKGRTAAECKAAGCPPAHARPAERKVTFLKNPLNTKHRKQADGFGHAVDTAPYPIDWNNHARFDRNAKLMFRAAAAEGVRIRWGKDWDQDGIAGEKGETDGPHFELVR